MINNANVMAVPRTLICFACIVVLFSCSDPQRQGSHSAGPVVTVASTAQIARINGALADSLSVTRAYAVRSATHEWGHFIAAKIRKADDNGMTAPIGLWFMFDGMDIPGEAFGVNQIAQDISSFAPYEFGDDGAADLLASVEVDALLELTTQRP